MVAAHAPEVHKDLTHPAVLFEEGDISILATQPWYSSKIEDDSSTEGDGNDQSEQTEGSNNGNGEDDDSTPLGMQVILQISISNPKAQRIGSPGLYRRKLLQEVGVIWSNFTQVFRSPSPETVCDPYDLYPLAMHAHEIANNILPHPLFNVRLVEALDGYHEAHVVSSWTIGTQVYDEYINYLGPLASTPFFVVVKCLHEAFVFMTIAWVAICLFKFCRAFRVSVFRWCKQHSGFSYRPVPTKDEEHAIEDTLHQQTLSPKRKRRGQSDSEMEMTVTYLSSKAMKRRNSTVEH